MNHSNLVLLRRFASDVEARLAMSLLESAEIECFITDENISVLMPSTAFSCGVWVRAEDAEVAEALLSTPEN
ncbi:MAG: DUF2007 domain-containing protein [Rikenellaceae bacterium]|nr:DUF2007 domain-containing protein [Rikenellaceae bacterium]MBO7169350.1 DUF2007 domain-containing protein [Rikenellaceae bacterium]